MKGEIKTNPDRIVIPKDCQQYPEVPISLLLKSLGLLDESKNRILHIIIDKAFIIKIRELFSFLVITS